MRSGVKPPGVSSFVTSERPLHFWEPQFLICIMGITLFTRQGEEPPQLELLIEKPKVAGGCIEGSGAPSRRLGGTTVLLLLGRLA